MKTKQHAVSRRGFIALAAGGGFGCSLAGCKQQSGHGATRNEKSPAADLNSAPVRVARSVFSKRDCRSLNSLLMAILPQRPHGAPDFDAIGYLERTVGSSLALGSFRRGLSWMDRAAEKLFDVPLSELDKAKTTSLLKICYKPKSTAHPKLGPLATGAGFTEILIYHAYRGFYSSQAGWAMLGFTGPPQRPGHCG